MQSNTMTLKLQRGGRSIKESFRAMKWYEWLMMAVMMLVAVYALVLSCLHIKINLLTGEITEGGYPVWLAVINCISALAGCICIFFTAKASIANFLFAVINTVAYIIFLIPSEGRMGTLILEAVVYFPMNIISWVIWARHRDDQEIHLTKSRKMNWWQNILTTTGIVSLTVLARYVFNLIPNFIDAGWNLQLSPIAKELLLWTDSATFAIGVIAIFLEAFRFREQYAWWLIVDVVAVAMYIIAFDPVYLVKKGIYLIMAVIGLINWIKLQRTRNQSNE